ncbi:MAG: histidine phosphatase family protein [Friedmanniella sp.]|nr:histidine phosphatase family protein [Friedmanniella sp.]
MEADGPGPRTLVLVRHAKSSWDLDVDDHQRPLSSRGRRDAQAIGTFLGEHDLHPDLVLCSTAVRTRETWTRAAADRLADVTVRLEPTIYRAWVPELVGLLRALPDSVRTAVLVGHAPGVPDVVEHLCPRTDAEDWNRLEAKFPTSGVALVEVPGSWAELGKGRARLRQFAVPRG